MRVCTRRGADNLHAMEGPVRLGDRYEVRGVLGFGGMAEVRDGWDHRLNRAVAIKLLHPGMSSQAETCHRFKVEACAAAALNHPNIVGVYDFGDQDATPFIVMERLSGETLSDRIALGPLPQQHVYGVLRDVLAALAVAHAARMLHRDIKPGNILLSDTEGVKVADFGIVKAPGSVHTTTGQLVGTLAYLSPDRIAGIPASVTDDLYAVGGRLRGAHRSQTVHAGGHRAAGTRDHRGSPSTIGRATSRCRPVPSRCHRAGNVTGSVAAVQQCGRDADGLGWPCRTTGYGDSSSLEPVWPADDRGANRCSARVESTSQSRGHIGRPRCAGCYGLGDGIGFLADDDSEPT